MDGPSAHKSVECDPIDEEEDTEELKKSRQKTLDQLNSALKQDRNLLLTILTILVLISFFGCLMTY